METCYICGAEAFVVREPNEVAVGTRTVTIQDEFYRCPDCGETFYAGDMAEASFRRIADAVRAEDGLLFSSEIVELRKQYGLSQADLERLIGAGPKTVVRWERGTVHQNKTADTLLRVLQKHPEVAAELARERGVELSTVQPEAGADSASDSRGPRGARAA
jgi:HTH-type transcriptional regulator / antitoxin MqsA